jgi:hypothetical protein
MKRQKTTSDPFAGSLCWFRRDRAGDETEVVFAHKRGSNRRQRFDTFPQPDNAQQESADD